MIQRISRVDLRLVDRVWPFAVEREKEIAAHWARRIKENPALWNGKTLRATAVGITGGCLAAEFVETDYAAYVAWRDWGYPDKSFFNIFGVAVVCSKEAHLLFGRMGAHTVGGGLIYPPAGSLDPGDADGDGKIDVFASALRELREETGLNVTEARQGEDFVVWCGQQISVTRVFEFDLSSEELARRIGKFLGDQSRPELAEVIVLKTVADIERDNIEPFARAIAWHLLGKKTGPKT